MALITRREARMIAQELHRLMMQDKALVEDEYLTTTEAAALLKLSVSYVRHNMERWPQVKRGGRRYFSKQGILDYIRGKDAAH